MSKCPECGAPADQSYPNGSSAIDGVHYKYRRPRRRKPQSEVADLRAAVRALTGESRLLLHKVLTCGVAAEHPDATLTTRGAYAEKWDSPQAQAVRRMRASLTAEVARLKEREAELQDLIEAMWVFADAKHTYTDAFKARIAKAITP